MSNTPLMDKAIARAVRKAIKDSGRHPGIGATLPEIMKAARPDVGSEQDYRDAVLSRTEVVAYTPHGDPLRVLHQG